MKPRLRIASRAYYCISAQDFLQMHKFWRTCATNLPAIEKFLQAVHNNLGFNHKGRENKMGFRN
jgi:hypothetical protein